MKLTYKNVTKYTVKALMFTCRARVKQNSEIKGCENRYYTNFYCIYVVYNCGL